MFSHRGNGNGNGNGKGIDMGDDTPANHRAASRTTIFGRITALSRRSRPVSPGHLDRYLLLSRLWCFSFLFFSFLLFVPPTLHEAEHRLFNLF